MLKESAAWKVKRLRYCFHTKFDPYDMSGVRTLDSGDDEFFARSQKCDPLFLMGIVFGCVNTYFVTFEGFFLFTQSTFGVLSLSFLFRLLFAHFDDVQVQVRFEMRTARTR